ncbi:hypothetical protein Hanom_Chr09g00771031 [Helianthus anomalus]
MERLSDSSAIMIVRDTFKSCPDLRGDRVSSVSIPFIDQVHAFILLDIGAFSIICIGSFQLITQMAESGAHVVMVVRNTKAAHELI